MHLEPRVGHLTIALMIATVITPLAARADEPPFVATDTVTLEGLAFSTATGLVRINQSAGIGNQQTNVAIIRLGRLSDAQLDTIVTQAVDPASKIATLRSHDRIVVSSGALAGARGLIQINESAGNGNASSNTFLLTVTK